MPRPITRIVSSSPLTTAQVRTHAPAVADMARNLAGRVRYLYELASGSPAVTEDGSVIPPNPQGKIGVDRSGPPWGDALQHPMWVWEGTSASTSIYGEKPIVSLTANGQTDAVLASIIVRPFQRGPLVPYSLGELRVSGIKTSGAGNATCVIRAYGSNVEDDPARQVTLTMTSTTAINTATVLVPLKPGYCERLIRLESTSANGFAIVGMSINQVKRRSH